MNILKPSALRRGDTIGIVTPASPPSSLEKFSRGIRYLEQLGYRIVPGKHLHETYGYLAGSDRARAADMNKFFSDPRIKAIFVARGGYGSLRLLQLLDYQAIKRNPKIFVGYSDITALQLAMFTMTGLITFSGPMVATEFGGTLTGTAEEQFWRCLTSTIPLGILRRPARKPMKPLRAGRATGRLLGGNLSLVTALLGTPFFPALNSCILVLEEIDEPPYKIDRMLHHLKLSGAFSQARGVALGGFVNCLPSNGKKPSLKLHQVFADVFSSSRIPVLSGLPYGHVKDSFTLPLGIRTRLNGSKGTLEFLESAVR